MMFLIRVLAEMRPEQRHITKSVQSGTRAVQRERKKLENITRHQDSRIAKRTDRTKGDRDHVSRCSLILRNSKNIQSKETIYCNSTNEAQQQLRSHTLTHAQLPFARARQGKRANMHCVFTRTRLRPVDESVCRRRRGRVLRREHAAVGVGVGLGAGVVHHRGLHLRQQARPHHLHLPPFNEICTRSYPWQGFRGSYPSH
jgi:hypothetical protein